MNDLWPLDILCFGKINHYYMYSCMCMRTAFSPFFQWKNGYWLIGFFNEIFQTERDIPILDWVYPLWSVQSV